MKSSACWQQKLPRHSDCERNPVVASARAEPLPVATGQPKAVSQKRPLRTALIACGSLLLLGLVVLCIGGIWYGLKSGVIPAPEFLRSPTPTFTPSPTMTPSPTFTPTATITPTPTQVTFDLNVVDDFSITPTIGRSTMAIPRANVAVTACRCRTIRSSGPSMEPAAATGGITPIYRL